MDPNVYPTASSNPAKPKNYLIENIIAAGVGLLCCCGITIIPGVIGVVFATQVDTKYTAGDFVGAASASNTAKILFYVSVGLVVLGFILNIIWFFWLGVSFFGSMQKNAGLPTF